MKTFLRNAVYKLLTTVADRDKLLFLLTGGNRVDRSLLGLKHSGYLKDIGWIHSMDSGQIEEANGGPLPWVTYPFIAFIAGRLKNDQAVFEFGSGNSTLFYAKSVAIVRSVESNRFWYDKIIDAMPANVRLFYCAAVSNGDYARYALNSGETYDLVIIDGDDRTNCCMHCDQALKPGGVVVLDDSEREEYHEGILFLTEHGFKRIDFWGTAPTVNYLKCTTVFYKTKNCLGI